MFALPDLPYEYDALQPTVSPDTLHHHHDKHHAKYVETLNGLVKDTPRAATPLEHLIAEAREARETKLFNQSGQAWNHGFFWECMTPDYAPPGGELSAAIDAAFGSLEGLQTAFVNEGTGHFASGWVWLAWSGDELKVLSTHDADTLADREDVAPLLVADLWEHAYYLDYQQDRAGFLKGWFDKVVNWTFVEAQFKAAKGGARAYRYPTPVATST